MSDEYVWPIDDLPHRDLAKVHRSGSEVYNFPSTELTDAAALASALEVSRRNTVSRKENFLERHGMKTVDAVLSVVVLLLVVVLAGGFLFLQRKDYAQSEFDSCQQSVSIYQASTERLKKTVNDAQPVADTAASDVADAKTLDNLHAAIADAKQTSAVDVSCVSGDSGNQNKNIDAQYTEAVRDMGKKNDAVITAVSDVNASKDAKVAEGSKQDLKDLLRKAQDLMGSKAALNADPTAKQQLNENVNQIQTVLSSGQLLSSATYQGAITSLQQSMDAVNSSALG